MNREQEKTNTLSATVRRLSNGWGERRCDSAFINSPSKTGTLPKSKLWSGL